MNPAPKDAPVEPDFAAMFSPAWSNARQETIWTATTEQRDAILSALAAGRQAAPQPEGALKSLTALQLVTQLFRLASENQDFGSAEAADVVTCRDIAREALLNRRIATLKAALRKYGDHQDEGCFAEPEKRCMCGLDEAMGRDALTTARAGKGEE